MKATALIEHGNLVWIDQDQLDASNPRHELFSLNQTEIQLIESLRDAKAQNDLLKQVYKQSSAPLH